MIVEDLGLMPYKQAWDIQLARHESVLAGGEDVLLLVEHPSVLTLGANFHEENLLMSIEQYKERGIDVVRTDRGGDVTYHGPGQSVIYPIFDLNRHGRDLHRWMRGLEQTVIEVMAALGLEGERFAPHTGVWRQGRKVAAIGVKVKRWTNLHGIAINCNNNLGPFSMIVPCGIQGHGVSSLSLELDREVTVEEVKTLIIESFQKVFADSTTA
jgi:lipoyl(octanoyl) transferase